MKSELKQIIDILKTLLSVTDINVIKYALESIVEKLEDMSNKENN